MTAAAHPSLPKKCLAHRFLPAKAQSDPVRHNNQQNVSDDLSSEALVVILQYKLFLPPALGLLPPAVHGESSDKNRFLFVYHPGEQSIPDIPVPVCESLTPLPQRGE